MFCPALPSSTPLEKSGAIEQHLGVQNRRPLVVVEVAGAWRGVDRFRRERGETRRRGGGGRRDASRSGRRCAAGVRRHVRPANV